MVKPEKWWWGVLPLLLLTIIAFQYRESTISSDIAQRVDGEAKALGLTATVSGRDVTLAGTKFDADKVKAAVAKIQGIYGVRKVNDITREPPVASPYVWQASRRDGTVQLTGNLTDPSHQDALLDTAKQTFAGEEIKNEFTFAGGAPNGFKEATTAVLSVLPLMKEGEFSLSDTALSVAGIVKNDAVKQQVEAALKNLPAGFTLDKTDISVLPPFQFAVSGKAGQISETGADPSIGNTPDEFAAARETLLKAAALMHEADVSVSGQTVDITGKVKHDDAKAAVLTELKNLPAGFKTGAVNIDTLPPFKYSIAKKAGAVSESGDGPEAGNTPDGFADVKPLLLKALEPMHEAALAINGQTVTLTGTVINDAVKQQVLAGLKDLPAGFKTGDVKVSTLPPFKYSIVKKGGAVSESGDGPDAGNTPDGFADVKPLLLKALEPMHEAALAINGQTVALTGTVINDAVKQQVLAGLKDLPAGFKTGDMKVSTLPPCKYSIVKKGGAVSESGDGPEAGNTPDGFADVKPLLLKVVGLMHEARLAVTGQAIALSGTVNNDAVKEEVLAGLKNLPAGFKTGDVKIDALPPFKYSVSKKGEAIRQAGGNADDANAPEGFADIKAALLKAVGLMSDADLTMTDKAVTLTGTVKNAAVM
ncbi:MAG: BON domain-containing protein [Methylobacteriaceae bacterium]|jgi:OOP family OmpA-OmpF porin|nr:BON domain-containing protein [Methylobacteriaceae bacterium]